MAFGIVRVTKLKSIGSIGSSAKHNFRERETQNAETSLTAENRTEGAQNSEAVVEAVKGRLGTVAKVRKNAVLAVEYFVGASPEWMQTASREQQEAFFDRSLRWLQARHGAQNVVSFTVHRDELTPHACAFVDALDAGAVGEIHLAGYEDAGVLVIDDHGSRVHAPVWQVFAHTMRRLGPRPTLIEWDTHLPALDVLLDEARLAQSCAAGALS
mgnify:CR=1 FL=1